MSYYRFRSLPQGIEVQHKEIFPFAMGCTATVLGLITLYFLASDLQNKAGLDYWIPLVISIAALCIGLYLVLLKPWNNKVLFIFETNEIEVTNRGLLTKSVRNFIHKGLETLSIRESDNDGYWYIPTIELSDDSELEIGFGCATIHDAKEVVDRITQD